MELRVIDSHTEGEPTRVIIDGGPDLGHGTLAERRARFASDFDHIRRTTILEPRGSEVLVGALLCPPVDPRYAAGVLFFNNVGMLQMCGHGTIGLAATLAWMGRLQPGNHTFETPVGPVGVTLHDLNTVTIDNVPARRAATDLAVEVPGFGSVVGDVAWGGNWFFLIKRSPIELHLTNAAALTHFATRVKNALHQHDIRGDDGNEIDHIEIFGPPAAADAHSRNFVLCPGGAWDRSPCGTGTSAKLACLAADDLLDPGATWVQESIIGSRFEASYRIDSDGNLIPSITGRAFITSQATLHTHPADPFATGIGYPPA